MCEFVKIECLREEEDSLQSIVNCSKVSAISLEIIAADGTIKKVRLTPDCLDSMIDEKILQPK